MTQNTTITPEQEHALATLKELEDYEAWCSGINKMFRERGSDFPMMHLHTLDDKVNAPLFKLLDEVLGDEIASYYFFECLNMKDGGAIHEKDGPIWPVRNLDDVRAYVTRGK